MEKGIYDEDSRFFAPYYQQAGFLVYMMSTEEREPYLELAYLDVKAAFEYYMENYNEGRPIVIAGFSQGADLCIRLMKDCFTDEEKNELLVACYAIGWSITEEELEEYPHLRFATGGHIWTFTDKEITTHAGELAESADAVMRLRQLISINPDKTHSTVTGLWVGGIPSGRRSGRIV